MLETTLQTSFWMASIFIVAMTIVLSGFSNIINKKKQKRQHLPSGALGFPVIGESISFIRAQIKDSGEEWINERVCKYGPVFKTSLMGSPTIVITGQSGNKFVFGSDYDSLSGKQPRSLALIAGKYSLSELPRSRYMLVKEAMISFLKPESLQLHVKRMDSLILSTLLEETKDKQELQVVKLMKKLTFDVACTVLFGIHEESVKKTLLKDFTVAFRATWSLPINLPGTIFRKGINARQRIINTILPIVRRKKDDLINGNLSSKDDMISCLLSLGGESPLTELEVIDNFILLMIASHDSTANLSCLMIWKLARSETIYKRVREEHMCILRERQGVSEITWSEIQKMKYTWKVAQELMRHIPLLFGNFRTVVSDTSFAGYDIPKGWKVFWAACGTHMDKDIFEDPTRFDPSRFDTPFKPIPPYAYVPFGAGTHTCIGSEYGRVEVLNIVHHFVTRFEWSQLIPEEKISRQPMPYPSQGLPVMLKSLAPFSN